MSNFRCKSLNCAEYDKEVVIQSYCIRSRKSNIIYTDSVGDEFVCKDCGMPLTKDPDEPGDFSTIAISTFGCKSSNEKKEILKKRANDEFTRNKQMREYKEAADREEV